MTLNLPGKLIYVQFPPKLLAAYQRHIRGKMKCPPSHSALNPTHNHTLIGYNPHIDLISHLHVIYILFTGKQDFKFLVMGFLALLGTFQAPGHLILGPSNTFHEKGTRYQRNFKFRREWRKMHQVHMKHDRPCISEYTLAQVNLRFPRYIVPFPQKRVPQAREQVPQSLKCPRECQEPLTKNFKSPFLVNNM